MILPQPLSPTGLHGRRQVRVPGSFLAPQAPWGHARAATVVASDQTICGAIMSPRAANEKRPGADRGVSYCDLSRPYFFGGCTGGVDGR
jgi:hypothetical protein